MHGVVLEEIRESLDVGEVVDPHELDVGAPPEGGTKHKTADAAESVDANPYTHNLISSVIVSFADYQTPPQDALAGPTSRRRHSVANPPAPNAVASRG